MIDERTTHLNLPLPHAQNLLEDDVQRIRQALTGLDAAVAGAQSTMSTALAGVSADLLRRIRRLRLNQLLHLNL